MGQLAALPPPPRGNGRNLRHGGYARLRLAKRAEELTQDLRPLVPLYTPAHEPAIQLLAMTLARCEAASVALAPVDEAIASGDATGIGAYTSKRAQALDRLRQDARGWIRQSVKLLETLGRLPRRRRDRPTGCARRGRGRVARREGPRDPRTA